jgi:hypothetical protein
VIPLCCWEYGGKLCNDSVQVFWVDGLDLDLWGTSSWKSKKRLLRRTLACHVRRYYKDEITWINSEYIVYTMTRM